MCVFVNAPVITLLVPSVSYYNTVGVPIGQCEQLLPSRQSCFWSCGNDRSGAAWEEVSHWRKWAAPIGSLSSVPQQGKESQFHVFNCCHWPPAWPTHILGTDGLHFLKPSPSFLKLLCQVLVPSNKKNKWYEYQTCMFWMYVLEGLSNSRNP